MQINLETDPVFHGRTKVLRLINYVLVLPRNLKHNLGQIYHLCEVGETEWDPTVGEEDLERPLFKYETKVIKKIMKPDLLQKL